MIADAQYGVISLEQLTEWCALSTSAVSRRVRRGTLHRWAPRVFAVGHTRLQWRGRAIGALLFAGDGSVLSHVDAAELAGLLDATERARVHVTLPVFRHPTARVTTHHSVIAADEHATRRRLPLTSVPRTVLDLADTSSGRLVEQALNRAHIRALLDLDAMERTVARARGRRGLGRLRQAYESYLEGLTVTRSMLEEAFLAFLRERGFPLPLLNEKLLAYEADFFWPAHELVVETDGLRVHTLPGRFEHDRRRDRKHRAAGLRVERITWGDVTRRPDELDAEMRPWFGAAL